MSDKMSVGHGPILVGHCPMTDSYLQLCKSQYKLGGSPWEQPRTVRSLSWE